MPEQAARRPTGTEPAGSQGEQLPLRILACRRCEETTRFLRGGPSDDRYCLALLRRAIYGPDDEYARACLYAQYAPLVLTRITHQRRTAPILFQDGSAPLVNRSCAPLTNALTAAKRDSFATLESLLASLKLCVRSVVRDEVRARRAEEALGLPERALVLDDPAETEVAKLLAKGTWRVIGEELQREFARVLVYLVFMQGLIPDEISSQYQRLFPSVEDVYRIKRTVLERRRRNRRLRTCVSFSLPTHKCRAEWR